VLAGLLALLLPAASLAAITTFGSPLSVPATLNTTDNLGYEGTNTPVPGQIIHTSHFGTDTALWNPQSPNGAPTAPATGQATKISLEGCAMRPSGAAMPLTQIHFQDLSPLPGGGARVNLTSQAFDIPVCGQGGASGATVTTYEPINLCVGQGDYVAFNDEGGFEEPYYRAGVAYQVFGSVRGATVDSFIKPLGSVNGSIMPPSETGAMEGFAVNEDEELMMRATLGTGPDATHICAGGTRGLPPPLAPIRVSPQTDGINHARIVAVAVYCRVSPECKAVIKLSLGGRQVSVGQSEYNVHPNTTTHLPIRVSSTLMPMIRKHNGVATTLTAVVSGKTVTQTVEIKIF